MVEPLSLALISGAAGIGLAVGRLSKSPTKSNNDEKTHLLPPPSPQVKFYQILESVDPKEIIHDANTGKMVFINIKKMISNTDNLYKFLRILRSKIEETDLDLKQISKELLILHRKDAKLDVKKLRKLNNKETEDVEMPIFAS